MSSIIVNETKNKSKKNKTNMNQKRFSLLIGAVLFALIFILVGAPKVDAAMTISGNAYQPSGNLYLFAYTAAQGNPCAGTGAIGAVSTVYDAPDKISPDNNFDPADIDYEMSATDNDGTTYFYLCNGVGSGTGNLLDSTSFTTATDGSYTLHLASAYGDSLNTDLNGKNVVICNELDGAKINNVARQVASQSFEHFYLQHSSEITNDDIYLLFTGSDSCTFDSNVVSGRRVDLTSGSSWNTYGIQIPFSPDTKAVGDLHSDLSAAKMELTDADGDSIGLTESVAAADGGAGDDDYVMYYDKPASGDMTLTVTSAAHGTTVVSGIAYDSFTTGGDLVNKVSDSESPGVPDDIVAIITTMAFSTEASATYSTTLYATYQYALYTGIGGAAQTIYYQKPAGTTVFQKDIDSSAEGDDTVDVAKVSGDIHAGMQTGDDLVQVASDNKCVTIVSTATVNPSGDTPNYEIYFEDTGGTDFYLQLTEEAGATDYVSCGNYFTLANQAKADHDVSVLVSGTVHSDILAVLIDNNKSGALVDLDVWTDSIVSSGYRAYTVADSTSQVVFDDTDNTFGSIVLTTVTEKDFSSDGVVDVAKVTGTAGNTHADLGAGDNLIIYDANDGTTQMSSETVDLAGAPYNQYFEVPTSLAVNIEVNNGASLFYIYNKTVAAAGSYTFEPNKKHTTTLPVNTIYPEVIGGTYTYRDKTLAGVGPYTSDIYLDMTETNSSNTLNIYSENTFDNVVLAKTARDLSAGGTSFNVNKLGGSSHSDLQSGQDTVDVLAVYDGGNADANPDCTGARIDSEVLGNLAATYAKYYEHATDNHYIWVKLQVSSGGQTYSSCIQTDATMASAGADDTYNLNKKLSGNVGSGITKVLVDVDGDSADWEFINLVDTGTTPDSYLTYGTFTGDNDIKALSGGSGVLKIEGVEPDELIRTGKDWSGGGPFTFNVGKVTGASNSDLQTAIVYSDSTCSTAVSSETENPGASYTQYFEGTDGTPYYVAVADATYTTCRTTDIGLSDQEATSIDFDRKISGRVPATTSTTLDVLSVAIDSGTNDYWSNTNTVGTTDYIAYIDGTASTDTSFQSAVGGGGTTLLTVNRDATTDQTINVSAAYGNVHGDLDGANDKVNAICDSYKEENDTCDTKYSTVPVTLNSAGAYEIFFEEQGGGGSYYLEALDNDSVDYYSWNKFSTGGTAGSYINVELDGKLSGRVREAYDSSLGVPVALVGMYTDGGNWPTNEVARTYSYGTTGDQSSPAGNYRLYGNAGTTYDAQVSKDGYVTDTDDGLAALSQTKNWDLASGVKIVVKEYHGQVAVTEATVTLYSCSSTDPGDCDMSTPKTGCTDPVGDCTRTGDDTAGNGADGEYYFAGLEAGKFFMIKIEHDGFDNIVDPDPGTGDGLAYTISTSAVEPNNTRGSDTYYLMNPAPACTVTLTGGAGTYYGSGTLYARDLQTVYVNADCGEAGLSVVADLNEIGGSATQTMNDNGDGTYSCNQAIDTTSATAAKTIVVVASDGSNESVYTNALYVDNTDPSDVSAVNDPGSFVTVNNVTWDWTGATDDHSGLAYYNIQLAPDAGCATPIWTRTTTNTTYTVSNLTDGTTYYFCVQSVDNVGNTGSYVDSDGVLIDTEATNIVATPPFGTYNEAALSAAGGVKIVPDKAGSCKWDTYDADYDSMTAGNEFAVTASTDYILTNLTGATDYTLVQGLNTIYVRCKDSSGNKNLASTKISFYYDTVAPTYQVMSVSSDGVGKKVSDVLYAKSGDLITVKFTASEELSGDPTVTVGGQAMTITNSDGNLYTATRTLDGSEATAAIITISGAIDLAGNDDDNFSDAGAHLEFDFTAPSVSVTAPGTKNSKSFTISATADTNSECRMDHNSGIGFDAMNRFGLAEISSGNFEGTYIVEDDGDYTIYVVCRDYAGNDGSANTGSFTVSTKEPSVLTISPNITSGWETGATVAVTITTDVNATCKYDKDEAGSYDDMDDTFTGGGTTTHTANIANEEGTNYYHVLCQNVHGKTMTQPIGIQWKGDTVAPSVPLRALPTSGDPYKIGSILYWSSATDATSGVISYDLQIDDDSAFGSPGVNETGIETTAYELSSGEKTSLNAGTNYWRVRAVDNAGNAGAWTSGDHTFTLDKSAPTVSQVLPADGNQEVGVDAKIAIFFDTELDGSTVNSSNFKILDVDTDTEVPLYADIGIVNSLISDGLYIVELTPADSLEYDTEYYVTIANVTDVSGNAFAGWTKGAGYSFKTAEEETVTLAIDNIQINPNKSYATANDDWDDGWEWWIDLTVPDGEDDVSLMFSDFTGTGTDIPAADNIRYYSEETNIGGSGSGGYITIDAAGTYPGSVITVNDDFDPYTPGNQIRVVVQVKVPVGSSGSYSAQFRVKSE